MKKKNYFLRIVFALFIFFLVVYIISNSGYYEAKTSRNVIITNEAMKEFEKSIINGDEIDLDEYIKTEKKDYSNKFTKAGDKFTDSVLYFINNGISGIWDALKVLFFG